MNLPGILDAALAIAAVPPLCASAYLALLAALSRRGPPPAAGTPPRLFFDVIVPAHDEEAGIGKTVRNLLSLDYPRQLFRVTVVADNCTDQTAARARELGASVIVRQEPQLRGKGYALSLAFARALAEGRADAVVVVDADSVASPNLLRAYSERLEQSAMAVQAYHAVLNPDASWRTRLMSIALAAFHRLRSRARERLGVSCGLRGNGMCLSCALLREIPHEAYSITEDLEYGLRVSEAGHRIHYAEEGRVSSEMVTSERASRSQRRRWEQGRGELASRRGLRLLMRALRRRNRMLLDLALDLLVPPLATLWLWVALGLAAAGSLSIATGRPALSLPLWTVCVLCLAGYLLRGWALSGTGARGLLDLVVHAPLYVLWKITLRLRPREHAAREWVRTSREGAVDPNLK
jgi:cellulose synthase/poly-beta-1,6-N-acetylglucosamine synthase-like glycosyltransferase